MLAPGAQIGRYHLLRRLAIGGMAELHLACAEGVAGFQKVVVLKRVLPHLAEDPDFVRLFLNEARLAAHLDHPNVVSVIDIGEAGHEYFFAMEYVHGRNAREVLREASNRGGMPLDVALTIVVGAAAGLHCAHEAADLSGSPLGIVHRDVSPANLLISYDGAVRLTDFGIAKAVERPSETVGGAFKGKIGYMSPEQCRGETVDRRSDVFALGVVLFELTTCERLFFADNDFAILNNVIHGRYDRPSARVRDYPPALEAIVMRALALDPAERYPSADALRDDLEAFAHEQHLRLSTSVVADWMLELYGRPPFPRVELQPPDSGAGPAVPTLVLAPPEVPTSPTEVAVLEPFPRPPTQRSTQPSRVALAVGATIVALAGIAGVAAWQWMPAEPDPRPAEAVASDDVAEPVDGPPAVPADDSAPAVAVPEPPAEAEPALEESPEAKPSEAKPSEAKPSEAEPSEAEPSSGPNPAKKKRTRRKKAKRTRKPVVRDLDTPYPVDR